MADQAAAIKQIITETYGDTAWAHALADSLVERIPTLPPETREATVRSICWDWMTGGTIAEGVAQRIEQVLSE